MNKRISLLVALALLAAPAVASAHQVSVYDIGGTRYELVVGSLNEPIAVDDNTGVEFRVTMPGHETMAANDHHGEGGGITGLEGTLKVELIAGDKRKTLDLIPMYGEAGVYYAKFFPTVATTFSYRIFGTMNDTPVDLTFTCRAEGAEAADEGEKEISAGVTQISKRGGFGCPAEKSALGFPEESAPITSVAGSAQTSKLIGGAAFLIAVAALALALRRRS